MKIIITEEQYKKIFLSGKYDNLITEQLGQLKSLMKTLKTDVLALADIDLGLSLSDSNKLKDAFNLPPNIILDNIQDLVNKLTSASDDLTPLQFKSLMKVTTIKPFVLGILKDNPKIQNLLTLRATAENLNPTHPTITKIDNLLKKFLSTDQEVEAFVARNTKDPLTPNSLKSGQTRFSATDVKNIFGELKTQSEVLEWMKKNKQDLTDLTNGGNYVNVFSEEQRKLWKKINDNLNEMLPIIKNMDDEVLKILKTNDINPEEFKKTLLKVLPSKASQFFIKLMASPFGKTWIGRKIIYSILGYMVWRYGPTVFTSVLDFVDFVTSRMSGDNKEEADVNIKSKFETWFKKNSPEGGKLYSKNPEDFTITINGNDVSLLDKAGVLGDKKGGKVYNYEYDETNNTFKVIGDDETQSTGTFENSLEGFKEFIVADWGKSINGNEKYRIEDKFYIVNDGTQDFYYNFDDNVKKFKEAT